MFRLLHHKQDPYIELTVQYKKGAERKRQILAEEEERVATSRGFSAYGRTLKMVPSFMYLGILLLSADDDWKVVIQNLTKALSVWRRITSILSKEGESPQVSAFFLKSVVQS